MAHVRKKNTVFYLLLLPVLTLSVHKKEMMPSPLLSELNSLYTSIYMSIIFSGTNNTQLLTGTHSSRTHTTAFCSFYTTIRNTTIFTNKKQYQLKTTYIC